MWRSRGMTTGGRLRGARLVGVSGLLLALALWTAACGGGGDVEADTDVAEPVEQDDADDAETDVAAFCDQVEVLSGGDDDIATFQALAAEAPPGARAEMEEIAASMTELDELAEDDEFAALEGFFELLGDPDFQDAVEAVERSFVADCGVEVALFDFGDLDITLDDDGFDDDGFDDGFDDDDGFGPTTIRTLGVAPEEVDAKVAELFGDGVATGRGQTGFEGQSSLDLTVDDISVDEALAGCEELAAFLAGHPDADGTATLEIGVWGEGFDKTVLAENDAITPGDPGTCQAV